LSLLAVKQKGGGGAIGTRSSPINLLHKGHDVIREGGKKKKKRKKKEKGDSTGEREGGRPIFRRCFKFATEGKKIRAVS